MTPASPPTDANSYLEAARPFPGENRFIVGTFERNVTFYRQQVRALNLIYALKEATHNGQPTIAPGSSVGIVGGGAFGVTAAAAAAFAGFRVLLFERHQSLLHLQRGCDTRWVHPRFYDWPAPESDSDLARLPLLDWRAATAAEVATQIQDKFELLRGELGSALQCVLEVSEIRIVPVGGGRFEIRYRCTDKEAGVWPCEAVVVAVGFGVEAGGRNNSYWRNDGYGQSDLSFTGAERVRYVVSGIGDGGLVDVFRLTIRDFRYEKIFSEMFPGSHEGLHSQLTQLQRDRSKVLYDAFLALESGAHAEEIRFAKDVLRKRRRVDTAVTLNSRSPIRKGLTLDKVSLSNALLLFLLHRIDAVAHEEGAITVGGQESRLVVPGQAPVDVPWLQGAKLIVRHGTDRRKALREVGCEGAVEFLRRQCEWDSGQPIFPAGWWGYLDKKIGARKEFVPPALMTHATTFVSSLASVLQYLIDKEPRAGRAPRQFRVALHRLARLGDRDVFQQVTPYAGRIDKRSGIGRFYSVDTGIVGLAVRTGSLVIVRRDDQLKFDEIWRLTSLHEGGANPIRPNADSLLACPFFAPDNESRQRVLLVLFVDSDDASFFDEAVQGTISAACRGFVEVLEKLYSSGALRPIRASYSGYEPDPSRVAALATELRNLGASFIDANQEGWKEGLTFKTLKSVDLEQVYLVEPELNW